MGTHRRAKELGSDRPSWPDERGTEPAALPSYWPQRLTQAVLAEAANPPWLAGDSDGPQSDPLWDRWFERALEAGVDEELASLGCAVIRAARELGWDEDLRGECGWCDEGEAMLDLAVYDPERAEAHWRALLDGD
jgi:hypothetical protein